MCAASNSPAAHADMMPYPDTAPIRYTPSTGRWPDQQPVLGSLHVVASIDAGPRGTAEVRAETAAA